MKKREAVRRYNAWPELESIVSELPDDAAGDGEGGVIGGGPASLSPDSR